MFKLNASVVERVCNGNNGAGSNNLVDMGNDYKLGRYLKT